MAPKAITSRDLGPALGMQGDRDFDAIVRQYIEDERPSGAAVHASSRA